MSIAMFPSKEAKFIPKILHKYLPYSYHPVSQREQLAPNIQIEKWNDIPSCTFLS